MLKGLFGGLVDIVYPRKCPACKENLLDRAGTDFICGACRQSIKHNLPPFCHSCGRRLDRKGFTKNICPSCLKNRMHFDRAFSPCVYDGPIKELIHEFKYNGRDYLGPHLSKIMTDFIKEYHIGIDYLDAVLPVPLSEPRLREREFNQAQILAKDIAEAFNKELLVDTLCRSHCNKAQAELTHTERMINVSGTFSVRRSDKVSGKNLIIIDDVLTTGATSSEAARALKDAGANIVFVLTLAN
jgi:competence protein ComFC